MKNRQLAAVFHEIADFLEMEEVNFKPYAYRRVALSISSLERDIEDIYKDGGLKVLKEISGVGENLALKIEEFLKTGKIKYHERLKKKTPVDLQQIMSIEGMGPRRARILYEKLKVKSVRDLEKAAKAHKIAPLFGFGEKVERNILQGIKFLKKSQGRFLLGEILPEIREIYAKLNKFKEVEKITVVGSLRRMKETIGDADILIASKNSAKVMDFFVSMPGVEKIWAKGPTKSSVRFREGFNVDIRVVAKRSYGAALQYFTGSKDHNILLRNIAISRGLKLNEYGLYKGKRMVAGKTEQEIYKRLGLQFIEPEMRLGQGEIEAASKNKLPKLVKLKDINGDLHCHSSWNGGEHSIKQMAERAQGLGYEYIGISDHTKFLRIENGLNEKQLEKQRKEIDKLNKNFKNFRILQGVESNIMNDGSIDIKDEALAKLDYVIAGVHSNLKMPKAKMTERIIRAMKNPNVDIISHPTGRLLKKRDEYQIDLEKIIKATKQYGVVLEINSSPQRLDLNGYNIRKCKEVGVKMVINTDSHRRDQLKYMEFGVGQARRGWAEKKDIINAGSADKLLKNFS